MKIIAYTIEPENDQIRVENSLGLNVISDSLELLLPFLCEELSEPSLHITWDLDATIAPLLKLLGKERCEKLAKTNKCFYRPFSIFYIPGKVFSIKPVFRHEKTNFYDLEQYFPDHNKPDNVFMIAEFGEQLLEALAKMKLYPTKLTSPVAIWEQCVMNHLNLPTGFDAPEEAMEYAWYCSGKLWTEAYQIGYWEQAWDYDIVASFPSVARDLIDIRHCKWVKANHYIMEAIYGYCKCVVTIYPETTVSPIIYIDDKGNLSTPTGTWETYLTLAELDFILKWAIGKVEMIDGWWVIPLKKSKPLQIAMARLLIYKDSDDELVRMLAKRMSVGAYGKFGEEWADRFGKHFCPAWFSEISTQVRLQVAEWIYENKCQDHIIHISVDGVLLDCPVEECKNA